MAFFQASSWISATNPKEARIAHCGRCGLSRKCHSPRMAPCGRGKRKILFVAEAPGLEEDRRGVQLVGEAGQCLRKILRELGEDIEDCWRTNAVICRPPENKIESKYVEACRPNLLKTIKELKPKVIILLGMSAVESLLPTEWKRSLGNLRQWVGWTIPSYHHGAWICPTYHPSYILRTGEDPILRRALKEDLRRAFAMEREPFPCPPLDELQKQVEIVTKPREAALRLRELTKKTRGTMAFDYETTGLKPEAEGHRIVSCSFCFNGRQTWAAMMTPRLLRLLSRLLRNPSIRKVASNLKFEERWTRQRLGHGVAGWYWDTMLAAHVLDNRPGITSLKFQAYTLLGVPDYEGRVADLLKSSDANGKNSIDQITTEDLLLYNGLDSLLEYLVMKQQRSLLGAGSWFK